MNGPVSAIKYHGGLVAGDPLWLELWTPGTITVIKQKEDVNLIQKIIREHKALCKRNPDLDPGGYKDYLQWKLEEEYGW